MIRMTLGEAARVLAGRLHAPDAGAGAVEFTGLAHDSRRVAPDNLFAALPGARVDGHEFVADALGAGAAAALVERRVDAPLAQIEVADVARAIGRLARHWRASLPVRVVGITGSNGKTTVKNMLAAILSRVAPTLSTSGNYNNEIGVPLTLAGLDQSHRFAVVEMGCGRPGDIAYLAGLTAPQVGVVTNAGPAHLDGLGDLDGVARTKGELFAALGDGDWAVINRDDPYHDYWAGLSGNARRITFGLEPGADVGLDGDRVTTPAGSFGLELDLPGAHNRANALAAAAAAVALGIEPGVIAAGLARVAPEPGRLESLESDQGWHLIDDSYNANPASLYAALQVLGQCPGRRWLALGDMAELGVDSDKLHREIGRAARDLGVERLFAVGERAQVAADAFGRGAESFDDIEALIDRLGEALEPDVHCLVKGSRAARMERVVQRLCGREGTPC